jgi:GPI ethanolamine phosphate transferase 2/3 subunit F
MTYVNVALCYVKLTVLTHVAIVLMGAPLLVDILRTFLLSSWIVIVGFSAIIFSSQGNLEAIYSMVVKNYVDSTSISLTRTFPWLWRKHLVWGTIGGAWLGAILIPLDWDRWWQRWPITCWISSTLGAFSSLFLSYVWLRMRQRQKYHDNME